MTKSLYSFLELLLFLIMISFALLLAFGKNYSYAVTDGLNLWLACVLPSLFPYFFITAIFSSLNITSKISSFLSPVTVKSFKINGSVGYAFFMSVISGYPVGAKIVSDLKIGNNLSDAESVRAAALCSTSSPMFLISSVGRLMFGSSRFGILLFICHLFSVLTTGLIFSFYKRKDRPSKNRAYVSVKKIDNLLYESVFSAVNSVLIVGGLITVFYLLTEVLFSLGIFNPFVSFFSDIIGSESYAQAIAFGFFECTRGLKAISSCGIGPLALPLCAAICGFGGLSVIAQSVAYLKKAKIKTAPFLISKLLSAVLGFVFGFIASLFFF